MPSVVTGRISAGATWTRVCDSHGIKGLEGHRGTHERMGDRGLLYLVLLQLFREEVTRPQLLGSQHPQDHVLLDAGRGRCGQEVGRRGAEKPQTGFLGAGGTSVTSTTTSASRRASSRPWPVIMSTP